VDFLLPNPAAFWTLDLGERQKQIPHTSRKRRGWVRDDNVTAEGRNKAKILRGRWRYIEERFFDCVARPQETRERQNRARVCS
jgi:hypothetical protein